MVLVLLGVLLVGSGVAYVASEDVRYVARAAVEEGRILQGRLPIERLIADSSQPPELRASLSLVLEARDYAAKLGLRAGATYTTYAEVGRDTLLLVLSASPKDCLCPHTWKFPIVGRVPYKGFFDPRMAVRASKKLEEKGYDVYLRPSGAFSTLGWFNDPLLSTAVERDSVSLATLVFHEIAHNTLYVKSATPFNESFAQFVGYRAAESFFLARGDSARALLAAQRWQDEIVLGEYYADLAERLTQLYSLKLDSAGLDSGRADAARWAREQLEGPVAARLQAIRIGQVAERPINNARIIAARIYRDRLGLFERWYELQHRDLQRSVAELKRFMRGVEGERAYEVLEEACR